MKTKIILTIIAFFVSIYACNASKFINLQTTDSVDFYYKWKSSKIFDKDSPLILIIKIKNTNNYAVEVAYTVDYFWQGIRQASSSEIQSCIKQKKAIVLDGRKQGFDTGSFTNEQIQSEDFLMELSGVKISKTEICTK